MSTWEMKGDTDLLPGGWSARVAVLDQQMAGTHAAGGSRRGSRRLCRALLEQFGVGQRVDLVFRHIGGTLPNAGLDL